MLKKFSKGGKSLIGAAGGYGEVQFESDSFREHSVEGSELHAAKGPALPRGWARAQRDRLGAGAAMRAQSQGLQAVAGGAGSSHCCPQPVLPTAAAEPDGSRRFQKALCSFGSCHSSCCCSQRLCLQPGTTALLLRLTKPHPLILFPQARVAVLGGWGLTPNRGPAEVLWLYGAQWAPLCSTSCRGRGGCHTAGPGVSRKPLRKPHWLRGTLYLPLSEAGGYPGRCHHVHGLFSNYCWASLTHPTGPWVPGGWEGMGGWEGSVPR